jgi:LPS-assembly lipoprotein
MNQPTRRRLFLAAGALAATQLLTGCGFRLRGPQPLAFSTIHLGTSERTGIGAQLARQIRTTGSTEVVAEAAQADVRLQILRNSTNREILSLSRAGKVREYQLTRELAFQLVDRQAKVLIPPTRLSVRRDYTFDDTLIHAKEQEEELLQADMQDELVRQLMRRLAAVQM